MSERPTQISLKERLKERYKANGTPVEDQYPPINLELLDKAETNSVELQPGIAKEIVPSNTPLPLIQNLLEENISQSLPAADLSLYQMCQEGLTNNQIAASLGINEKTVVDRVYRLRKKIEDELMAGFPLKRTSSFNSLLFPSDLAEGSSLLTSAVSRGAIESIPILRINYTTKAEVKRYLNSRRGKLSESVERVGVVASHRVLSPQEHDIVRRNKEFEELVFQVNGIECFYESDLPRIRELISPLNRIPITELEPETSKHSGIRRAIQRGRLKSEVLRGVHYINPDDYRKYKDSIKGRKRGRKPKALEEIS
jgi:hypothetical protein